MSRPRASAAAPFIVVVFGAIGLIALVLGEISGQVPAMRSATKGSAAERASDAETGGGTSLAARALGGLPSALPELPQRPAEGPYLMVLDALSSGATGASAPVGMTRPLELALREVGPQLTECVRQRQPQAPRDPLPFELILQRGTGRLHVLSLPPGIPASRGPEVSCLRQAIEKAESAELKELSAVVKEYLRLRVLVVNHVPGVTSE